MFINTKCQTLVLMIVLCCDVYIGGGAELNFFVKGVICHGPHIEFVKRTAQMIQMEEF